MRNAVLRRLFQVNVPMNNIPFLFIRRRINTDDRCTPIGAPLLGGTPGGFIYFSVNQEMNANIFKANCYEH